MAESTKNVQHIMGKHISLHNLHQNNLLAIADGNNR